MYLKNLNKVFFLPYMSAAFLYFFIVAPAYPQNSSRISIYFTGSLRGNLSGCECSVKPNSGLVRRFSSLNKLFDKKRDILLDTGDMLGFNDNEEKSSYILKVFHRQGYDAVVPGYQDITHPTGLVKKNRQAIPYVGVADISRIKKSILIEKSGFKIGIIGFISPKVFRFSSRSPGEFGIKYNIDYIAAESRFLRKKGADFVILLAHVPRTIAVEMSRMTELDAVIAGNDQFQPKSKADILVNGKYVLSAGGDDGEFIGKMVLEKKNGSVGVLNSELFAVNKLNPGSDPEINDWLKKHPAYDGR